MAYTYLSYGTALSILASRLQDSAYAYFGSGAPDELYACLGESLRVWQCLTASYKQKDTFETAAGQPYYDLPLLCPHTCGYHQTDVDLANQVLDALLEPRLTVGWVGSGQFTLAQLRAALQHRLNRFLGESGAVVNQLDIPGPTPPTDLLALPDGALDVRRAAWWTYDRSAAYPLGRADEWAEQAYLPGAMQSPDLPIAYSVFGTPPAALRLIPPPSDIGVVDLLLVSGGLTLNLDVTTPVKLLVPDDLVWAIKWGALADLLGSDGPCRDSVRATYCEQRYFEGVQLARLLPSVLTADLDNVQMGVGSFCDLDAYMPDWQAVTGTPSFLGMAGRNFTCLGCVPDDGATFNYSVGLWLVANMPTLATDRSGLAGYLQAGRDALDPILDYAQHIACFKMGGAEFDATARLYQNLIDAAQAQNNRLSAVSFYRWPLQQPAQKSEFEVPRQ